MRSRLTAALVLWLASACAAAAPPPAPADDVDTGADNLLAVLRESPGANHPEEVLQPIGAVRATLADGREVEIATSWFHYLGDMHVRLVFDGERNLQSAVPDDLRRLNLSPEQALAQAAGNLRRRYGAPEVRAWSGGLMQVVGRAPELASSYFLDREFWHAQLREHPQGLVAAVPQRGGLVFVPAGDEAALFNLRFSAAALYTSGARERLSSALYLFKEGRWSVWQAPRQQVAGGAAD